MYKDGCDTCWSIHFEVLKSWLGLQINGFGLLVMYIMLFKTVIRSTTKELKIKPFKV